MKILSADYLLPISSDPIAGGAMAIDGDRIASVGRSADLKREFPGAEVNHFGKAAILPGFVNCHSHLEITSMRGVLDDVEHDFRSWLLKLNDIRCGLTDADIEAAALVGAREGARAGITCFGDIGRYGRAGLSALRSIGLRGVLFQETEFSPDNRTAEKDFETLKEKFVQLRGQATDLVEIGLSPHSPYTVSRRLFELISGYATRENIRLSIHAAESQDEKRLLEQGEGFFMSFYERQGYEWEVPRCSSIEFLASTGILSARPLLAHCVNVSDADLRIMADSKVRIAHCPKSNAKFGHGYAPLGKFLNAGLDVGLGSDSVASNNHCDHLEEARFAALAARNRDDRQRFITAREVLELATIGGAAALGLEKDIGTLETGKQADLAVVSLSAPSHEPINEIESTLVFSSNARDVVMTMVAGREIYTGIENGS
jgi:cytosine/adenosine deaminase-related metal-dependent hydrolase